MKNEEGNHHTCARTRVISPYVCMSVCRFVITLVRLVFDRDQTSDRTSGQRTLDILVTGNSGSAGNFSPQFARLEVIRVAITRHVN